MPKCEKHKTKTVSNVLRDVQRLPKLPSTLTELDWCSCEFRFWARRPSVLTAPTNDGRLGLLDSCGIGSRLAVCLLASLLACLLATRPTTPHACLVCFVRFRNACKFDTTALFLSDLFVKRFKTKSFFIYMYIQSLKHFFNQPLSIQ